jgi:hypothetical protein
VAIPGKGIAASRPRIPTGWARYPRRDLVLLGFIYPDRSRRKRGGTSSRTIPHRTPTATPQLLLTRSVVRRTWPRSPTDLGLGMPSQAARLSAKTAGPVGTDPADSPSACGVTPDSHVCEWGQVVELWDDTDIDSCSRRTVARSALLCRVTPRLVS